MSDKGRKPEDRSNAHKGSRGSPVSGLAQLGPSATMMPPHGSYEMTSSPHPLHHHLPYGAIIRPPSIHHMAPHIGRMTNDLGPPIFMPSLNLGVPKPSTSQTNSSGTLPGNSASAISAVSTVSVSKTTKSNLSSQPSMNTPAFMPELIQFPSAFHPPPPHTMRALSGQGHTSYIPVSAPPPPTHPSSMNMKLPAPSSLSSSTIAKPTPIPASGPSSSILRPTPKPSPNSQGVTGTTMKQQPIPVSSKGVISSSLATSKGEVPSSTSVTMMSCGYPPAPHMMSYEMLNAGSSAHGQLSKMLLGSPLHPTASRLSKGDGSKAPSAQVSSSASLKSAAYAIDGYNNRSSSFGLSTSGQPTSSAATYMDTKMEHPPQPSAVPLAPSHPVPSLSVPSSAVLTIPPVVSPPTPPSLAPPTAASVVGGGSLIGGKDRPTTAEAAASNLIISKQALTGKQIASITGNATTNSLGQSSLPDSAYTSPVSNSTLVNSLSVNNNRSSAPSVATDSVSNREQGPGGVVEWSATPHNRSSTATANSSSSASNYLPSSMVATPSTANEQQHHHSHSHHHHGGGTGAVTEGGVSGGSNVHYPHHHHPHQHTGSQQQQLSLLQQSNGSSVTSSSREGAVLLSMATSTVPSSTSSFTSGHLSGGGGVMGSPSKNLTASPGGGGASSSPRPHILRGVKRPHDSGWKENSHHSPGSSAFLNKLSNSNSTTKPKVSRQDYASPLSPSSHDGGLSNHLSTSFSKSEPSDMTASPRKKPRKQNVIANDDRYASNVPDGFVSMATSETQAFHEGGGNLGEEILSKSHPPYYNSLTSRNGRIKTEPRETGGGAKEMEVRYLSQLKRCPYPINGVYKVHHRAARNHFRRHADIKHREEHRMTVYDIADDKSSLCRASGWKIVHFSSQLQEMSEVEEDILKTMQRLQDSVNNLNQTGTCQVDNDCASSFKELVQGNVDRSSRVLSHYTDARSEIDKVLEHRQPVVDLLKKYSTVKSSMQSLLLSSNHHKSTS